MVAYGSFTNSNLTDGGTNRDFGQLGGRLREVVARGDSTIHCAELL